LRREARKFLGYFVWKITILRYYIRLPPLFCGVRITYVYPRCFVEFVLHTFGKLM
jgi:hypothetical protein